MSWNSGSELSQDFTEGALELTEDDTADFSRGTFKFTEGASSFLYITRNIDYYNCTMVRSSNWPQIAQFAVSILNTHLLGGE